MKMDECRPRDEIFTHVEDDGLVRHINASAMFRESSRAMIQGDAELVCCPIDSEFVEYIRAKRGVEQAKLDRLCEPYLSLPIVGVWMDDGSCLTVDGHHRMVKLHELGVSTYKIIIYSEHMLARYCIEDVPSHFSEFIVSETKAQRSEMESLAYLLGQ